MIAMRAGGGDAIQRVNFAPLDGDLVVVAVGGRDGAVSTDTWRPRSAPSRSDLTRAEAWLRERLPVVGTEGIQALRAAALTQAPREITAFLADALERAARLLAARGMPDVRVDGADHIASQPEFQAPGQLRPLVSLLANQETLARALDAFSDEVTPRVAIGREITSPEMRACSIVGMGVVVGGMRGVIGVMGPVRMPYRRVVSLVSYVGDRLLGAWE